jgi:Zn-finger nucleic acid-binding protein
MTDSRDWITINDRRVDRRLLEARPTQRCRTEECQSWCCTGGVWLDVKERDKILANAELIKPHLPPDRRDESRWFEGEDEHPDYPTGRAVGTQVVDDPTHRAGHTCLFLRPEDRYCALQVTSLANSQHPWSLKPFYCALHPITTEYDQVMLDDDNEIYTEGGNCQRAAETALALYEVFENELKLVLGEEGYEMLKRAVEENNQ